MSTFEIIAQQGLKMIKATINNETIRAESGALHYMQGRIELKTPMPSAGGILKSMVTAETIVRPTYTGTGTIFFGPPIFGEHMILELNNEAWVLDRGAYVCSDNSVEVGAFRNKAMSALMSGEGWFQTKVEGKGKVVLQAQGPVQAIDLRDDKLVVDGSFAVARQAQLDFSVQRATKGLLGSAASGEGLVNVIQGTGRVYIAPIPNAHVALGHQIASNIHIPRG
jgi:uncharacterized protein (AIM24 family)